MDGRTGGRTDIGCPASRSFLVRSGASVSRHSYAEVKAMFGVFGKQGPHISCKKPTICEFIISRHQNSLKVRGIRVKLKMTQLPEKG